MAGFLSTPQSYERFPGGGSNLTIDNLPSSLYLTEPAGDPAIQRPLNDNVDHAPMTTYVSDANETSQSQNPAKDTSPAPQRTTPPRTNNENVEDETMTEALILRLNNYFTPLDRGDTFVYIGLPPQEPEQNYKDYQMIYKHFNLLHRIDSVKLKSLQSAKFLTLLGPRSVRTERRFWKEGLLSHVSTAGIKYFVDLRPPCEDEEAVVLVTELTCTQGVLNWHKAQKKYGISRTLICGQDDSALLPLDWNPKLGPTSKWNDGKKGSCTDELKSKFEELTAGDPEKVSATKRTGASRFTQKSTPSCSSGATMVEHGEKADTVQPHSESLPQPEYSLLRHCSAIERLLNAIDQKDPKLDSAPKLWTYLAVAKYFDCATHERINGWIMKWLFTPPNHNFIQCNPEVTYRIGLGINTEAATKDAFSILVGEKALLNVLRETDPSMPVFPTRSAHGRKIELLDDDERNRIDHAAASLVKRVRTLFESLVDDKMAWLQESAQYKKITSLVARSKEESRIVNETISVIKHYVRNRILWALFRDRDGNFQELEPSLTSVQAFYTGMPSTFNDRYRSLHARERIFTRTFWLALQSERLNEEWHGAHEGSTALYDDASWNKIVSQLAGLQDRGPISDHEVLREVTKRFNRVQNHHAIIDHGTQKPCKSRLSDSTSDDIKSLSPLDIRGKYPHSRQSSDSSIQNDLEDLSVSSPKRMNRSPLSPQSPDKRRRLSNVMMTVAKEARSFAANVLPPREADTGQDALTENVDRLSSLVEKAQRWWTSQDTTRHPHSASQNDTGAQKQFLPTPPLQDNSNANVVRAVDDHSPQQQRLLDLNRYKALHSPPLASQQRVGDFMHDSAKAWSIPPSRGLVLEANTVIENARRGLGNLPQQSSFGRNPSSSTSSSVFREDQGPDLLYWDDSDDSIDAHISYCRCHPAAPHVDDLLTSIDALMHKVCEKVLYPAHLYHGEDAIPTNLVDTLMCLEDEEWKYLPLWAGGCDDGSGGVFDEVDVPNLEAGGFRGGKRGMGSVNESESRRSSSEFSDIASEAVSTVGRASKDATDGTQTVKSLDDDVSDTDFMNQDALWDEIRTVKDGRQTSCSIGGGIGGEDTTGLVDYGGGDFKGKGKTVEEQCSLSAPFNLPLRTMELVPSLDEDMVHENAEGDDSEGEGDVETIMGAGSDDGEEGDQDQMVDVDLCDGDEVDDDDDDQLEIIDKNDL